jgi:hypothetical protein
MNAEKDEPEPAESSCRCAELPFWGIAPNGTPWSRPRLFDITGAIQPDDGDVPTPPAQLVVARDIGLAGKPVPISSSSLDFQTALHANADLHQLSLLQFLE